jgi:hypothetical protein
MRRGCGLQLFAHPLTQRPRATEEPQAATHLEQHCIRRLEANARREAITELRDGIEQRVLAPRIARHCLQAGHQRQGGLGAMPGAMPPAAASSSQAQTTLPSC